MGLIDDATQGVHTRLSRMWMQRSITSSVITGEDPTHYDASNPITLFIIQLFIIIVFTQGIGWVFGYIKQPKVIAEVIGGILLGPTVFGRIPHFSETIFPQTSLPNLNLISMIGLILFLFLVGLEVDVSVMKKNGRNSAIISAAGMILPFGLGSIIAIPIYHNFVDQEATTFGHFLLFVGVAMSITAFPVLCRILTSAKLLDTKVGIIVLAAGVGNDVVGWVLLALTLALVSAQAGQTAVYVLLCAVGWSIVLLWPIRKAFMWVARRTGSIDQGSPTPAMMVITLLLVFASAFMTGIIGVHPIFGGFIAGLIIPHEGGFAISLVERIDDLVSMLFLPIYFVLSGLSTNLGLLNTGKDWGYVVILCVVAWTGKFVGCAGAARLLGYRNRESGAIGMLMSCKGLVELIVLNVGLQAGIINQRLFSMFVVEAVVLTFITTPVTLWIYPERVRTRGNELEKKPTRDVEKAGMAGLRFSNGVGSGAQTNRFLVVLQKIEHLAAVMLLAQMLEPSPTRPIPSLSGTLGHPAHEKSDTSKSASIEDDIGDESRRPLPNLDKIVLPASTSTYAASSPVQIDALKLIELTGRFFSVMQSAEKDQLLLTDDALQLFRQFGRLRGLDVTPHISIVGQESFPAAVAEHADMLETEMVIVPWTIPLLGNPSSIFDSVPAEKDGMQTSPSGALSSIDGIFAASDSTGSPMYTHFLRRVFNECPSDVALFVDRGFGSTASFTPGVGQHVFLPFFGGPDDRLALQFVVQLCHHPNVTATIVRITKPEDDERGSEDGATGGKVEMSETMQVHQAALNSNQLTIGGANTPYPETANRLASETADDLAWAWYTQTTTPPHPAALADALAKTSMYTSKTITPLTEAFALAESPSSVSRGRPWRPMLIVLGRGRKGAAFNHGSELTKILAEKGQNPSVGAELRKTVGDCATAMILGGGAPGNASFLILESGKSR